MKSYPDFVREARAKRPGLRFVHIGAELDDPSFAGLKAYLAQQWNDGVEPTFPSYVVLDSRVRPLHPLAFNDLPTALAAAEDRATLSGEAGTAAACGRGEAAYARFLSQLEPVVVTLDTTNMSDLARQLEEQTGARIVVDWRIADRLNSFKGQTLNLGAFQTLRGPYPFAAIAGDETDPPTLVLWDMATSTSSRP